MQYLYLGVAEAPTYSCPDLDELVFLNADRHQQTSRGNDLRTSRRDDDVAAAPWLLDCLRSLNGPEKKKQYTYAQ